MCFNLNISDKNVLTVMSSGDYLIMSHLFGAKNVECFDINPLTYRYFFLRKWLILNGVLEYDRCGYEKLLEIINSVSSLSSEYEKETNSFWKEIVKDFEYYNWFCNDLISVLYSPFSLREFYEEKRDEAQRIVPSLNPKFYISDLFDESGLQIDKKYDYVFISNIIDVYNNRQPERLEIIKRNLLNILESDGRIVCTHFPEKFGGLDKVPETLEVERKILDKDFDFQMIDGVLDGSKNIAYMYTRRK